MNNKPYRYSARAWEMVRRATVAPHDCVGSNIYAHVLRGTVKRIVPRNNEAINESWVADRDRFSYEAIYSADRLAKPRIKESGEWRDIEWEDALDAAAGALKDADSVGLLASPSSTVEEGHLLSRLADHLGTANIDHRIERRDFADQENDPAYPWLGCDIAELENQDAILVIGSNIRQEAPILAHRIRKAALAGASVNFVSSDEHEYFFDVDHYVSGAGLVESLSGDAIKPVLETLEGARQCTGAAGQYCRKAREFQHDTRVGCRNCRQGWRQVWHVVSRCEQRGLVPGGRSAAIGQGAACRRDAG